MKIGLDLDLNSISNPKFRKQPTPVWTDLDSHYTASNKISRDPDQYLLMK